ncbi:MAG TPA: hypothetical protein VIY27_08325 [Myxococcota bacterium]
MANFSGQEIDTSYEGGSYAVPGGALVAVSGSEDAYINRVYDSVAGANVSWITLGSDDLASGVEYPGPGTYGVDTSEGTIEAIIAGSMAT